MAPYSIRVVGDPVLRQRAAEVTTIEGLATGGEVGARAEGPAPSRDDDGSDVVVGVDAVVDVQQFDRHLLGERVELLGPVEGDRGHPVLDLIVDLVVGHRSTMMVRPAMTEALPPPSPPFPRRDAVAVGLAVGVFGLTFGVLSASAGFLAACERSGAHAQESAPAPQAQRGPTLSRGPYLQQVSATSVVLRWKTAQPCKGRVKFRMVSDQPVVENFEKEDLAVEDHLAAIKNLLPGTTYE